MKEEIKDLIYKKGFEDGQKKTMEDDERERMIAQYRLPSFYGDMGVTELGGGE